jgi:hypothetical protein
METNVPSRELGPLPNLNYQRLQTAQSSSDPEVLKLFDAHVPGAIGPSAKLPLSAKMRNVTPGHRPPKAAIT